MSNTHDPDRTLAHFTISVVVLVAAVGALALLTMGCDAPPADFPTTPYEAAQEGDRAASATLAAAPPSRCARLLWADLSRENGVDDSRAVVIHAFGCTEPQVGLRVLVGDAGPEAATLYTANLGPVAPGLYREVVGPGAVSGPESDPLDTPPGKWLRWRAYLVNSRGEVLDSLEAPTDVGGWDPDGLAPDVGARVTALGEWRPDGEYGGLCGYKVSP